MELNRVICTTCGNGMDASIDQSALICDACGNTFLVTNGKDLASKTKTEIGSIKKLRNNLHRAVVADDHKNILHFSKEILRLIPKDDLANYYYAYANYTFASRRYLFDYYDKTLTLPEEIEIVVDHIIEYSDVRDRSLIETFIARNKPEKLESYRNRYKQKLIDEENYSSIPRDVFISFRSTDIEIASKVLQTLERDGNTCWISSRNLRPNDNENYWANIEDAISKCKIFLVISSHDAMISRDVKKELDLATKMNKKRLEFKIDDSKHTSFFKYFFDGCKWIDAVTNQEDALDELKKRVVVLLNQKVEKKPVYAQNRISETDEFSRKINRAKVDLLGNNFKEAANSIKDALGINPENAEGWWMLFLAENEFVNGELFNEFIKRNQTIAKLSSIYSSVSYQQFKKYEMRGSSEYPDRIQLFEEKIYEQILIYINKSNLDAYAKKNYLKSYFPKHILTLWMQRICDCDMDTDNTIKSYLEDEFRVKNLQSVFQDFTEIEDHIHYDKSHIKEYKEMFKETFEQVEQKRKENLEAIQEGIAAQYESVSHLLEEGDFKEALNTSFRLFYFDNSSDLKYLCVLLSLLKAKNTVEAYDKFAKLRGKKQEEIMQSIVFEKLFRSKEYSSFVYDICLHAFYKKRKADKKISIMIGGETDGV